MSYNQDLLDLAREAAREVLGNEGPNNVAKLANAVILLCDAIENVQSIGSATEVGHNQEAAVQRVRQAAQEKIRQAMEGNQSPTDPPANG